MYVCVYVCVCVSAILYISVRLCELQCVKIRSINKPAVPEPQYHGYVSNGTLYMCLMACFEKIIFVAQKLKKTLVIDGAPPVHVDLSNLKTIEVENPF